MNPAENERKRVTPKIKSISGQKRWIFLFAWIIFIYGSFIYFFEKNILWESVGETLFRIFLLFLIILVNIGLGKKVLRRVNFKISSFLEFFLFSLGIGLTIFTYIVIALGLIGLFYKWAMSLLLLWLFIFCYEEIEDVVHQIKVKLKGLITLRLSLLEIILLFVLFIQIMFNLFGASVLPSSWDALAVHLAIPKEWGRLHRITAIPYFKYAKGIPYNIDVLYGAGLLLKDAILAKLINFALGIFTLIGIYSLSKKYFSRRIALISTVIFYTIPIVSWESTTAYVDLGFTFYIFLAFYGFINWIDSHKNGWLIISAIMSGMAVGSKITGFLCAGILFVAIIIISLFLNKERIARIGRNLLLFSAIVALSGAFWYARYFVLAGGSVSSLLSYLGYILKGGPGEGVSFTMAAGKFLGYGGNTIGILFLAFLPLLIFPRFRKNRLVRFSLLYCLIYLIFWAFCAPYKRGLIPVFPLISIMITYIISKLLNFNKFSKFSLSFMIIFAFVFQVFYLAPEGLGRIYQRMLVFTGLKSQEEYIFDNEETYRVFKYINDNSLPDDKVFVMNHPCIFYCERACITTMIEHPSLIEDIEDKEPLDRLRSSGITYLVVNTYLKNKGTIGYTGLLEEIPKNYLKVVYEQYPFVIYKINYEK